MTQPPQCAYVYVSTVSVQLGYLDHFLILHPKSPDLKKSNKTILIQSEEEQSEVGIKLSKQGQILCNSSY